MDVETCDPDLKKLGPGVRRGGYVVGIAFAIEDGPAHYLPVRHGGGGNLDEPTVWRYLRDQAKEYRGTIAGANLQYDLDYLAENDVEFRPDWFRDVQVAEPLCDELQFSYSLDNVAARRGVPGKDESHLRQYAEALGVNPKKDLHKLPSWAVGAYAEQDVRLPLQLLRIQERDLDAQDLWPVYDLESRLLPVLVKMRRWGVRIDFDQLDRIERWSIEEEARSLAEIRRLTGITLASQDVNKKSALLPLVQWLGVPVPKTATGQPSITRAFLDALGGEVGAHLNRARKFNRLRGTFVAGRRAHAVRDRVHCTFNQLRGEKEGTEDDGGARYGRLSCSDPNLQQEPARDPEVGPVWRRVYLPDEGSDWGCHDYSQQEPRWAVHFAEALKEPTARLAGDRYRSDPKTDSHDLVTRILYGDAEFDSWDPKTRKRKRDGAKVINLGLCYGMGPGKLCRDLGLPTKWVPNRRTGRNVEVAGPEGQAILDAFHERLPYLKNTADRVAAAARRNGYVRTVLGRKCRFPVRVDDRGRPVLKPSGEPQYDWTHKAFNRVIQGSSGDQVKQAMVNCDDAGLTPQLQVHDELDRSGSPAEFRAIAQIMRDAVPCSVPHRIDVESGPNWADIRSLEAE